jgi:trehalose/maltose hydrolase-like predicted phosphorylase
MGSVWQALVQGFAGIRPTGDALLLDPCLPAAWEALEIPVRYHETRLRVRVERQSVRVEADRPVRIRFPGDRTARVADGQTRFRRGSAGWEEVRS